MPEIAEHIPTFSKGFNNGLRRLYDANEGDVNFVCGFLNKNVHSLLLGARSKVFDAMLKSSFQEGHSKRIELKQQNPHLVARMLQHLYGFDYSGKKMRIGGDEESSHISELYTHAEMYALGDEFDMKDLKEEALWKFEKAMKAKKGHGDELAYVVEVIPIVYATTPDSDRGLRDALVAFGVLHLEQIQYLPGFKSAATEVPIYLIEVLPKFLERIDERRRFGGGCPNCICIEDWGFDGLCCRHCGYHLEL